MFLREVVVAHFFVLVKVAEKDESFDRADDEDSWDAVEVTDDDEEAPEVAASCPWSWCWSKKS